MKLICFDMDNTLFHSDKVHVVAFQRAFRKNRLPQVPVKVLVNKFGIVGEVFIHELFPQLTKKQVLRVVDDHDAFVIRDTARYIRVIRGVKKALEILRPHYSMAILSNVKHKEIVATLKAAGIRRSMFDVIVGNDEVRNPKPAPDAVRLAMKKTGSSDGYVVGDTVYDIQAGKGAGLKTIAVLTGHHSSSRLKKEKPDYILKSVADVPRLLLK